MCNYSDYSVYRSADMGDCSNRGITARFDRVRVFYRCTREEALQICADNGFNPCDCLFIVERNLWGEDHSYAEPLEYPEGLSLHMFGGNFIYSCDGNSFKFKGESVSRPIPVHDRFETEKEYAALSI